MNASKKQSLRFTRDIDGVNRSTKQLTKGSRGVQPVMDTSIGILLAWPYRFAIKRNRSWPDLANATSRLQLFVTLS